jgi:hypothetical protein
VLLFYLKSPAFRGRFRSSIPQRCCLWEWLPTVGADFGREQLMGSHESSVRDRRIKDAGVAVRAPVNHRLTASLAEGSPGLQLDMTALAHWLADGAFRRHGYVSL